MTYRRSCRTIIDIRRERVEWSPPEEQTFYRNATVYFLERMLNCTRVVELPGQAPAGMNDVKLRDHK